MTFTDRIRLAGSAMIVLLGLGLPFVYAAQAPGHSATPEFRYKGAPAVAEGVGRVITPGAPELSDQEYERSRRIYFERCAGCHGVLRKGATGKPLTPDITRERGTDYLRTFIKFGSPAGMPNWGTSGELSADEVDAMARYLQHEPPTPPEFGLQEMKASW